MMLNIKLLSLHISSYLISCASMSQETPIEIILSVRINRLKAWTAEEKRSVESILSRLLEIAPGLLVNASCGKKIMLARTTSTDLHTIVTSANDRKGFAAFAIPGSVVFADSFFRTARQFHALVHELVHEADMLNRYSFSKDWVYSVNGIICDAKIKFANEPKAVSNRITAALSENDIMPSAYSCESLEEALAEVVSGTIDRTFTPNAKDRKLVDKFLLVRAKDSQSDSLFIEANAATFRKDFKEAERCLLRLIDSEADLVYSHLYLARCYFQQGLYPKAVEQFDHAIDLSRRRGIPANEPQIFWALQYSVQCTRMLNKRHELVEKLSSILNSIPYQSAVLYERACCHYEDHDYSEASDLYLSCTGQDYALVLKNAASNIKLTEELLDKSVEKFPSFPQTLLRRGHFFEWLGDRAKSDDTRNEFYKRALKDYDSASKLDTVAFPEVPLDRFNLCIKLNDMSDARKVFESASASAPDFNRNAFDERGIIAERR